MYVTLAPHQEEAVKKLRNGSILWGSVGSGKSRTALAYYTDTEHHEDIYIITTAKKRDSLDWVKEAAAFGIGRNEDDTLYGRLVVDSWNNIGKYTEVKNAFFIFDEQRLVGNGRWVRSFLSIARDNNWILLSATPGDTWMDYIPVFVANGYYKNRTEFVRKHVVYSPWTKFPKVQRYLDEGHLLRLRKEVLVEMNYRREIERVDAEVRVDHNRPMVGMVLNARWHVYEDRPLRDVGEMFLVMRKVVNSDPSRLEAVKRLMKENPKLIIFYNFNYELEELRTLKEICKVAEWNGHKHEELPEGLEWVYLVQYSAGSEGWNCTETDSMIFYSLPYSYKMYHQAKGRIDRMSSAFSVIFYYSLISDSFIDREIKKNLDQKRSFNESNFQW